MEKLLRTAVDNNRIWTKEGNVATYIPELAKYNPDALGAYIFDLECNEYYAGDHEIKFTLQSVSKVIILICALIDNGNEVVFSKVGTEPSSDPFNSIIKLETKNNHKPLNPFINAGAIACTSFVSGNSSMERFNRVCRMIKVMADNPHIQINYRVYNSEKLTGDINRSIAYYLRGTNIIDADIEDVIDAYFKLCSIEVTLKDVAKIAAVIANGGIAPWSNERLVPKNVNQIVQSLMMTCGLYDVSGEFAANIGVPAKSGVGGCIMVSVPNRMGIAVLGPALDESGNSIGGKKVLEELSEKLKLSIFK